MQWYFILILSLRKTICIIYFRNGLFNVIFGITFKNKPVNRHVFLSCYILLIHEYVYFDLPMILQTQIFFSHQRAVPATRLSPLFVLEKYFLYTTFFSSKYRYFLKLSSKFSIILQSEKQITEQNFQITDMFHQFAVTTFYIF